MNMSLWCKPEHIGNSMELVVASRITDDKMRYRAGYAGSWADCSDAEWKVKVQEEGLWPCLLFLSNRPTFTDTTERVAGQEQVGDGR